MYVPDKKWFDPREFVPPQVYEFRGDKSLELIDDRVLITCDYLRKRYGPMTINNWHVGGNRKWSGLRTKGSPYGTIYSQHRYGRAIDCVFRNIGAEEVRQDILMFPEKEENRFINAIELETNWLHFDVRNCNRIYTFRG